MRYPHIESSHLVQTGLLLYNSSSMEDVTIGDDTLISTTKASELSGYSKDYIGQLCREDKIECRRVSGHWYVNEDGLKRYQENGTEEDVKEKNDTNRSTHGMKIGNVRDDTFSYDGIEYIATSRAADLTGYAQDYIGQLARGGEIEARKVGRRWFVGKKSLVEHKKHNDGLLAEVQAQASGIRSTKVQDDNIEHIEVASNDSEVEVKIQTDIKPGDVNFNVRYVTEENIMMAPLRMPEKELSKKYASGDIQPNNPVKHQNVDIKPIQPNSTAQPQFDQNGPLNKSSRDARMRNIKTDEFEFDGATAPATNSSIIINLLVVLFIIILVGAAGIYVYFFGTGPIKEFAREFQTMGIIETLQEEYGDLLPGLEVNYISE